ncbi:tRNA(Ile)-lysidine synthetase, partial [Candidatus Peregrinibacteria bacterium]|nr:tRNA(Ile)-lysidine synthetase [Candidatus Peregrinibacteria bacterium]
MNPQEQKKLEKKVIETLNKYLKKKDTIIVGVSGGSDSVFLYEILKNRPDLKIIVAHLNHSL